MSIDPIDPIMRAYLLGGTPQPAAELVSLPRLTVETLLAELEAVDPCRALVVDLRLALAEPAEPLWALYSVGPGEVHPAASKEEAEQMATDTHKCLTDLYAEKGWVLPEISLQVIPSPYEPIEHFRLMAEQHRDESRELRDLARKSAAECDRLNSEGRP